MKKLLYCICLILFTSSCNNTPSPWEKKQAELIHKRDSLRETDIRLSFMGMELGEDISLIDSAVTKEKIFIDSCLNGIYIGHVTVPCVKDTTSFDAEAIMRIVSVQNKIASIELFFKNRNVFDFFVDTYNERYYNQYEEKLYSMSSDMDYYSWWFKNQYLSVRKEKHEELGYGVVGYDKEAHKNQWDLKMIKVTDGISVEYHDINLSDIIEKRLEIENSIQDNFDNKLLEEKKDSADKKKKDLQTNI